MSTALLLGRQAWTGFRLVWSTPLAVRFRGMALSLVAGLLLLCLLSYHPADPSLNTATGAQVQNWLGGTGAVFADILIQSLGLAAWPAVLLAGSFGLAMALGDALQIRLRPTGKRALTAFLGVLALSAALSAPAAPAAWPLMAGLGGLWGEGVGALFEGLFRALRLPGASIVTVLICLPLAIWLLAGTIGLRLSDFGQASSWLGGFSRGRRPPPAPPSPKPKTRRPTQTQASVNRTATTDPVNTAPPPQSPPRQADTIIEPEPRVAATRGPKPSKRAVHDDQASFDFAKPSSGFELPPLGMLAKPAKRATAVDEESLRQNAKLLEGVLQEFGVRGVIDQIRPGPVVTLYELVPAPGVKHGRVVALADDIARSMSARACRISVVQGRNAIGIELPNVHRETVFLRDLLASTEFDKASLNLPLALGETIGGEPYVADLAKMPHLLIAGTTGSGKSVGVNAMILSILYRHSPDQCRFIMIDPKMLELSVYDGIPHLMAPVVTDPKKAVVALKWTVREMEDRYRRMSKLGVRNVASYNDRAREALAKGEHFERTVQTGFDEAGRPVYESEKIRPEPMPYLVVVMDEMADLMLVAGKDVEGAVQRLAQMARAAGIHLIMATQRPSVDVITGTIKANFPTRISFQVTSKIDSRTILGEQGGEQLLGQGDMLYMAGGGRITRLHGPFVDDKEVEAVCAHLRAQGAPDYLDAITDDPDGDDMDGGFDGAEGGGSGDDLYDRAVAIVTRDGKASTSYVQRRLQIGYNRAATLIERMEQQGVVSPANHAGKREVLAGPPPGD